MRIYRRWRKMGDEQLIKEARRYCSYRELHHYVHGLSNELVRRSLLGATFAKYKPHKKNQKSTSFHSSPTSPTSP